MKALLITIASIALAATIVGASGEAQQDTERQLKTAMNTELVDGNLQLAIEQYKKVADSGNRTLAAQALVQLGRAYEKLGDAEARKAYERVLREFSDQPHRVAEARVRVAALDEIRGSKSPALTGALTIRRFWRSDDGSGASPDATISTDGRYLAFADEDGDIAVRDQMTLAHRRLTKSSPAEFPDEEAPAISRDGGRIAYGWHVEQRSELRVIGREGGEPVVLYGNRDVTYVGAFDWSPDGQEILAAFERADHTNQIVLVSVPNRTVRVLKSLEWRWPRKMVFSPDGRFIAYDVQVAHDAPEHDVFAIAVDGSRESAIVKHAANDFLLGWFPDGRRVLFGSDRTGANGAWAVAVADGKSVGGDELLKTDIGREPTGIGFSGGDSFHYGVRTSNLDVFIAAMEPTTGRVVQGPTPVVPRVQIGQRRRALWSPDGSELAYAGQSSFGMFRLAINVFTLKTGQVREVPLKMNYVNMPIGWMPDGRSLIVGGTDLRGRPGLFKVDISNGDVDPVPIVSDTVFGFEAFSPDGRKLFFSPPKDGRKTIVVRDLASGREQTVQTTDRGFALSRDGQWLAFVSASSLKIGSALGGEPRTIVASAPEWSGMHGVTWSGDGRFLFYLLKGEVWRVGVDGGVPEKLSINAPTPIVQLDAHPDGRHLALTAGPRKSEIWVMDNVPGRATRPR